MNGKLRLEPNFEQPDDFYETLIGLHRDLSEEQSRLVNAKLILLLANHIGDFDVLNEAMTIAQENIPGKPDAETDKASKTQ